METLFSKMAEYVKMDDELPAGEFRTYYQQVMDKLNGEFDTMTDRALIQGKIITSIIAGNAVNRSKRKDGDAKRFRKMHEKSLFWNDAIEYRLKKNGLSDEEINKQTAEIEAEMNTETEMNIET